jgi:nitrate/nitrite transporter NarK
MCRPDRDELDLDLFKERRLHLVTCYALAAGGLLASTWTQGSVATMVAAFCVANFGILAAFPLFWTVPPTYLRQDLAPLSIAFINTLGITAGFISPYLFGLVKNATGSLTLGIYILAALLATCAVVVMWVLPERAMRVGTT